MSSVPLQDLLLYCSFALVLQLAIFTLYISKASQHGHRASNVVQHVGDALVAASPTGMPTLIITSLWRCFIDLKKQGIMVQSSLKIKTAAAVELVVFDKTGTLTGSMVSCVA